MIIITTRKTNNENNVFEDGNNDNVNRILAGKDTIMRIIAMNVIE